MREERERLERKNGRSHAQSHEPSVPIVDQGGFTDTEFRVSPAAVNPRALQPMTILGDFIAQHTALWAFERGPFRENESAPK